MNKPWTLDDLGHNIGKRSIALGYLKTPGFVSWPADLQKLNEALSSLAKCNPGRDVTTLISISLLASLLLNPEKYNAVWKNIGDINLPSNLLFDSLAAEVAKSGFWQPIPVVTVLPNQQGGNIHWFLVGKIAATLNSTSTPWPDWFDSAGSDFRAAIRAAFEAAQNTEKEKSGQLFVFPLINPHDVKNLDGRSVGLPIALASVAVLQGATVSPDFVATGDIHPGGKVDAVSIDTLEIKADCVASPHREFKLFLFPQENNNFTAYPKNIEIRPVKTLADALVWCQMFDPEKCDAIDTLIKSLEDVDFFVKNCLSLPADYLDWIKSSGNFEKLWPQLINSKTDFLQSLCCSLESRSTSYAIHWKQADALAALITLDDIDLVPDSLWQQHFIWCSINGGLANHSGENDLRAKWQEKATRFEDKFGKSHRPEYSKFVNRFYLIGNRHNAYDFQANDGHLPEKFVEIFEKLEKGYEETGGINDPMGELYGSLAQDFGFSGQLEEVERYVQKAQTAFGEQTIKDDKVSDYHRQFSYLGGAYIDAGYLEKARDSIFEYLRMSYDGLESWKELEDQLLLPDFDDFHHYFAVRLLAEIFSANGFEGDKLAVAGLVDLIFDSFDKLTADIRPGNHPWQLWSYNLGKLALSQVRLYPDKKEQYILCAKKFLEKSFEICSVPKEYETIYVMQLLPLSELYMAGLLEIEKLEQVDEIVKVIQTARVLKRDHFAGLLSLSGPVEVLQVVFNQSKKYFPFNYR